jgi:hypothetical protein
MSGFVYILSNPAMPNLLKIGKSDRDPSAFRAAELYTTGVPQPFKVEYFAYVDKHHELEVIIHSRLSNLRPNSNREFFTVGVEEAVIVIRQSGRILAEKLFYRSEADIRAEQVRLAKAKELEEQMRLAAEKARRTAEEAARQAQRAKEEEVIRIQQAEEKKKLQQEKWKSSLEFAKSEIISRRIHYKYKYGRTNAWRNFVIALLVSALPGFFIQSIEFVAIYTGLVFATFPLFLLTAESDKSKQAYALYNDEVEKHLALLYYRDDNWNQYLEKILADKVRQANDSIANRNRST